MLVFLDLFSRFFNMLLWPDPRPLKSVRLIGAVGKKGKRTMTIKGSCFCGSITYKVEGKLRDARSCHCSECRKAFSAQASAYALVDHDKFSWVSGENLLTSYESKKVKVCSSVAYVVQHFVALLKAG
jgi:hypothetical protein